MGCQHGCSSGMHLKFAINPLDMGFNGVRRDEKLLPYLNPSFAQTDAN
jgi:hypothetical protein